MLCTVPIVHYSSTKRKKKENLCRWISSPWYLDIHYTTPNSFCRAVVEVVIHGKPFQLRSWAGLCSGWPCQDGSIPMLLSLPLGSPSSHAEAVSLELQLCRRCWWDKGLGAVRNRLRRDGEILQERLCFCFLGEFYQRDDLGHL